MPARIDWRRSSPRLDPDAGSLPPHRPARDGWPSRSRRRRTPPIALFASGRVRAHIREGQNGNRRPARSALRLICGCPRVPQGSNQVIIRLLSTQAHSDPSGVDTKNPRPSWNLDRGGRWRDHGRSAPAARSDHQRRLPRHRRRCPGVWHRAGVTPGGPCVWGVEPSGTERTVLRRRVSALVVPVLGSFGEVRSPGLCQSTIQSAVPDCFILASLSVLLMVSFLWMKTGARAQSH